MGKELSLSNFLEEGRAQVKNSDVKWLIVKVKAYDNDVEIIVNPVENIDAKLRYYSEAYKEDLRLKSNDNIQIVDYLFAKNFTIEL